MIIKINTLSQIPLYLQLRNQIVKGIGKGELTEGESLPTVRQMAADLGINTMTVSKAYQLLKNEGFLYTDRRLGSIVHIPENEEPSSLFQEKLEDELELLSAEARIRGMNLEDFLSLCSTVFVEKPSASDLTCSVASSVLPNSVDVADFLFPERDTPEGTVLFDAFCFFC